MRNLHSDIKKVYAFDFFVASTYDWQFIDWYPIMFIFILFGIFAIVFFVPDSYSTLAVFGVFWQAVSSKITKNSFCRSMISKFFLSVFMRLLVGMSIL